MADKTEAVAVDPCCVLIVDDCEDMTAAWKLLAQWWGHRVEVAHKGEEALRTARECHPAVVLLDLGMPPVDGWELARRLRSEPALKETLLVAISGFGQAEDLRRSREAGCDCHLTKPVEPEMIRQILAAPEGDWRS